MGHHTAMLAEQLTQLDESTDSINGADVTATASAEIANATYLDAFGLYLNPFSLEPDDEFYFESAPLRQRMQTLQHMVTSNDALLCVTGDEGGGKTIFLRHFVNNCEGSWQPFEVNIDGLTDSVQVLRAIAASIDAQVVENEPDQINSIFARLGTLNKEDCNPIITIDDAHLLSPRALSAMQKMKRTVKDKQLKLSIVLFANREIKNKFNDKALRDVADQWLYSIYLPRLSQKDTEQYLLHRMTVAGMFIDKPFSNDDICTVYRHAKGLPSKTNLIAHRLLMCNYGSVQPSSKTRIESSGWRIYLDKFNNLSRDSKMYLALSVALVFVVATVGSGKNTADISGETMAMVNSGADTKQKNTQIENNARLNDKLQDQPKQSLEQSVAKHTKSIAAECDGVADLFVDCNNPDIKPGQSIRKNISYN